MFDQLDTVFYLLLQVKQSYVVAPHDMHFQVVYHFLKEHILEAPDYKVSMVVFFILMMSFYTRLTISLCSGHCILYDGDGNIAPIFTSLGNEDEC